MAKESRTRRRYLAESFLGIIRKIPKTHRGSRVIKPSRPDDPFYVFVLAPKLSAETLEKYREARFELLRAYCLVLKRVFPEALDIVGIAIESGNPGDSGEDALYLDAREWTSASKAEAKRLQSELGLLKNLKMSYQQVNEYPDFLRNTARTPVTLKGKHRNRLCPCNSGRKYKHCCGKQ